MTAASAAYLNKALEPTGKSSRLPSGSPPAFGILPSRSTLIESIREQYRGRENTLW